MSKDVSTAKTSSSVKRLNVTEVRSASSSSRVSGISTIPNLVRWLDSQLRKAPSYETYVRPCEHGGTRRWKERGGERGGKGRQRKRTKRRESTAKGKAEL